MSHCVTVDNKKRVKEWAGARGRKNEEVTVEVAVTNPFSLEPCFPCVTIKHISSRKYRMHRWGRGLRSQHPGNHQPHAKCCPRRERSSLSRHERSVNWLTHRHLPHESAPTHLLSIKQLITRTCRVEALVKDLLDGFRGQWHVLPLYQSTRPLQRLMAEIKSDGLMKNTESSLSISPSVCAFERERERENLKLSPCRDVKKLRQYYTALYMATPPTLFQDMERRL